MDRIQELRKRKEALKKAGGSVRKEIGSLVDENSFVELAALSFSKSEFYEDEARGEGDRKSVV